MARVARHVIDAIGIGLMAYATFGTSALDRIRSRASQSPADAIRDNWVAVGQNLNTAIMQYVAKHPNAAGQTHQ